MFFELIPEVVFGGLAPDRQPGCSVGDVVLFGSLSLNGFSVIGLRNLLENQFVVIKLNILMVANFQLLLLL